MKTSHYIQLADFDPHYWPQHHDSLVGSGVETFLHREAVHATDHPAVHLRPVLTTDLPPLASIFHLQKALRDGNPFPLRVRSPDPHVLHLHSQTLRNRAEVMLVHLDTSVKNINQKSLSQQIKSNSL